MELFSIKIRCTFQLVSTAVWQQLEESKKVEPQAEEQ